MPKSGLESTDGLTTRGVSRHLRAIMDSGEGKVLSDQGWVKAKLEIVALRKPRSSQEWTMTVRVCETLKRSMDAQSLVALTL